MIIVIKKADFAILPFSDLKAACEVVKFGRAYGTLIRKKYPIRLAEYVIYKITVPKQKKKSYNIG